jgi:hypothetical protein
MNPKGLVIILILERQFSSIHLYKYSKVYHMVIKFVFKCMAGISLY